MSLLQWSVIALNVSVFLAMITAFVAVGRREVTTETDQGDTDYPPLDYRQYRKT